MVAHVITPRALTVSFLLAIAALACSFGPAAVPGQPTSGPLAATSGVTDAAPVPAPAPPQGSSSASTLPDSGSLLFVDMDGFWAYTPRTASATRRWAFPAGTVGSAPTVSPDGARVAYAQSVYGAGVGRTDLVLANADGSEPRTLLPSAVPGDSPAFAADGRTVYAAQRGADRRDSIQAVPVDGSAPPTPLAPGTSPTVSAAGLLAYVTTEPATGSGTLWVVDLATQERRSVASAPTLSYVAQPRFDPTGQYIAFVASDQPPGAGLLGARPDRLFGPAVAYAHSVPLDIWVADAAGTQVRRLTNLDEHLAYPTWSQDGQWLAFTGEPGIYVVPASGEAPPRRMLDRGLPAGLTWLP